MIEVEKLSLRPATDEDRRFCFEVKRAALRQYVEPIWGWDEQVQIEFHLNDWLQQRPSIVALGARDIGTVEFAKRSDCYHLGEFYLFPEFQRHGIGTHLMKGFMREADEHVILIRLEVIQINPVRTLYLRCGFVQTGATKTHFLMERRPNKRLEDNAGLPPPSSVRSTAFARRLPGASQP